MCSKNTASWDSANAFAGQISESIGLCTACMGGDAMPSLGEDDAFCISASSYQSATVYFLFPRCNGAWNLVFLLLSVSSGNLCRRTDIWTTDNAFAADGFISGIL